MDVFIPGQRAGHALSTLVRMTRRPKAAARPVPADDGRTERPAVTSSLWYRAPFCEGLNAARRVPMIREHFADALGAAGWPDGACLFLSTPRTAAKKVRKDASAAEAVFFSPVAIAAVPHLIAACGAEPSPPPDRACATLLVGKQSDWDLLPRGIH
jgi:hypothetical protein